MEVSRGSGVCAALCIRRTLCRHVTIGTPMVIFCCLTVFDDWCTVVTVLVLIVKNTQTHWCTNRHRTTKTAPTVYQQCTNRQKQSKTVKKQSKQQKNDHWCTNRHMSTKNSQKTVKTAKMAVGVPIVTCLHRVRRIHKAALTQSSQSLPI